MATWRGESAARRNGGSGRRSGEAPIGPRAKSAKGRLAIDRTISHHHHHHHHHQHYHHHCGSRGVIYRPYLKPANCLFKHNKTAVPPFNLRGSPFRVRGSMPFATKSPTRPHRTPLPPRVEPYPPFVPSHRFRRRRHRRFRSYIYDSLKKARRILSSVITNGIIE